jgi:hypothetical protein
MKEDLGTTTSSILSNQPTGDLRVENVEDYVREAIDLFLRDPADSDFQRGYFCALVNVALEGLELPIEGNLDVAHQQTLRMAVTPSETGLTPQQLREQRDELLAAAKLALTVMAATQRGRS